MSLFCLIHAQTKFKKKSQGEKNPLLNRYSVHLLFAVATVGSPAQPWSGLGWYLIWQHLEIAEQDAVQSFSASLVECYGQNR